MEEIILCADRTDIDGPLPIVLRALFPEWECKITIISQEETAQNKDERKGED